MSARRFAPLSRRGPAFDRVVHRMETGTMATAGAPTKDTGMVPVNTRHTTESLVTPTDLPLTAMSGDRITTGVIGMMATMATATTGAGRITAFLSADLCPCPCMSRGRGRCGTHPRCRTWSSSPNV